MSKSKQPPRPYLSPERRRLQLLAAASALARREGWAALSMRSVAREAGVSRQTLYDHFKDAEALSEALLEHELDQLPDLDGPLGSEGASLGERLREGVRGLLQLPPAERRLLSLVAAGLGPGGDEGRRQLERSLARRWAPMLSAMTGLGEPEAKAAAGALIKATLGLADAADDGLISRMSAEALAVSLVTGAIQQLWDDGQ
ncbi:MAG: TetR/AcrR family transcriptional regulator [Alphaproteobacteria bacterium]|nr:TetR/AcrR family transcriptional regulator [Alphaproteobacteria bacterium]MCB9795970.1 TetR/AcrR family transcriptional regulator [Alphaproteobacteria bacterium]